MGSSSSRSRSSSDAESRFPGALYPAVLDIIVSSHVQNLEACTRLVWIGLYGLSVCFDANYRFAIDMGMD
jgi:hypothetical protein